MRLLISLIKEIFEMVKEEKYYWLLPIFLTIVILWLLITSAGTSSVPVFVYPVV